MPVKSMITDSSATVTSDPYIATGHELQVHAFGTFDTGNVTVLVSSTSDVADAATLADMSFASVGIDSFRPAAGAYVWLKHTVGGTESVSANLISDFIQE